MSIVGYQSGATTVALNGNFTWWLGPYTAPASGTISAVVFKLINLGAVSYSYGVYSDNAGVPNTKLAETASTSITDLTGGEHSINLNSPLSVTNGTKYWFAVCHTNNNSIYYDTVSSYSMKWVAGGTPGSLPATANPANTFATNGETYAYATISASSSAVITEQNLPANHNGNITVHVVGTGTSFTSSTTWTPSGVSGWSVASKTQVDGTHYTVVLTPPAAATPPTGATGTLTLTEGVTGSVAATTTVGTPTLVITLPSPASGATGTTPTLTLTGTNTLWASETAAGLFTVAGGTGASLATPTVSTNTVATDVLTVGTGTGTLTITDASTGATVTFTATAGTLAITAPVAHQFRWRGSSGTASLTISGTYTGVPTSIEWSSDGSTWATLDAAPSAGAYTGSVSLATGQYTLSTRFSNNTSVTATVTPVSVAYVLAVAGQSNASGRGTNNQTVYDSTYTHALKTASGYATLADPYGASVDGSSGGSFVPPMVSELANILRAPIGIVPAAVGATSITDWQSGQSHYTYLVSAVTAVGGCDAILMWQGEQDAFNGMSQSTYHTNLSAFMASVQTDLAHPVIQCLLQTADEYSQGAQDAINAAITAGWSDITGLKEGPDIRPIPTEPQSNVHLTTDVKLCQAGAMWAGWVYKDLFQPTGSSGGLLQVGGMTGGTQQS